MPATPASEEENGFQPDEFPGSIRWAYLHTPENADAAYMQRSIEIVLFVPEAEIDELYYNSTYYTAPPERDYAEEAFAVIREALSEKGMVGIGRMVFGSREHIIGIKPRGKGMVGTTLLYPYEVRKEAEVFDSIPDQKIDPEMVGMAHQLIKSNTGHFEPDKFEDRYENALREIIDKKMRGVTIRAPGASAPAANVVNLMEALKRSIRESGATSERRQPQTTRTAAKKQRALRHALAKSVARHGQDRSPQRRALAHRGVSEEAAGRQRVRLQRLDRAAFAAGNDSQG